MDNNNDPNAQAAIFSPATDFIETPVDNTVAAEPVLGEKSINIIDETPEAEDLITNAPQPEPATEPVPAAGPEPAIEPTPVAEPAPMAEPVPAPVKDDKDKPEIHFDPDHASDPENEALFNALREKLVVLRRERNELIAQIDKVEDELTNSERTKSRYEVAGEYSYADYDRSNVLSDDIRKLDLQCRIKERSIHSILGLLRTL